jgi:hypothetical protein
MPLRSFMLLISAEVYHAAEMCHAPELCNPGEVGQSSQDVMLLRCAEVSNAAEGAEVWLLTCAMLVKCVMQSGASC